MLYALALTIHSVSYYDLVSSKWVKRLRQKRPLVRRHNWFWGTWLELPLNTSIRMRLREMTGWLHQKVFMPTEHGFRHGIDWRLENSHISLCSPRQKGIRVSLAGLKVTFPPCLVSTVSLWIPWSSQLSWKGLTVHPIGCTCNFALAWPVSLFLTCCRQWLHSSSKKCSSSWSESQMAVPRHSLHTLK